MVKIGKVSIKVAKSWWKVKRVSKNAFNARR